MKKKIVAMSGAALILCALAALTAASMPDAGDVPENIKSLFGQRCAGCHQGRYPSGNLNLEPANVPAAVDAPSRQAPSLKLIDSADPDASYILKKVRRQKDIKGRPMPPGKALTEKEVGLLRDWIEGLGQEWSAKHSPSSPGGDLRLGDLDFRIGFNLFRTF